MAQPSNIGLAVDGWRPVTTWPAVERPPALWEWLTHTGSLTQKLRALAKDAFHVQVLKETGIELATGDAQLLGVPPGSAAQLREVYLCGAQPWSSGAHWQRSMRLYSGWSSLVPGRWESGYSRSRTRCAARSK